MIEKYSRSVPEFILVVFVETDCSFWSASALYIIPEVFFCQDSQSTIRKHHLYRDEINIRCCQEIHDFFVPKHLTPYTSERKTDII